MDGKEETLSSVEDSSPLENPYDVDVPDVKQTPVTVSTASPLWSSVVQNTTSEKSESSTSEGDSDPESFQDCEDTAETPTDQPGYTWQPTSDGPQDLSNIDQKNIIEGVRTRRVARFAQLSLSSQKRYALSAMAEMREPTTIAEAMMRPDWPEWKEAILSEYGSLVAIQ